MDPSDPSDPSSSVPYSPSFTSFGSPLTRTRGSLLSPAQGGDQQNWRASVSAAAPPRASRLRARDLYGGPLMFGGSSAATPSTAASLRRSNRLLVSTPYHRPAAAQGAPNVTAPAGMNRTAPQLRPPNDASTSVSFGGPNASFQNTSSISPSTASPMSSTAQAILDTLEKISTPVKDAQKIPVPRAERRRAIAQELLKGGPITSTTRRRPRLGNYTFKEGSAALSGPPLRTIFSPVSAKGKTMSAPTASLRSGQPTPVIVERRKTPRENLDSAAAEASLSSTSGGKVRAKVGEKAKGRELSKWDEDAEETPEYLTKSSDNPFLNMKAMPNLAFSTPAPGKTPEVVKKVIPSMAMPETPKSSKLPSSSPSAMFGDFKAPAKVAANNFSSFINPLSKPSPKQTSTFLSSPSPSQSSSEKHIPPAVQKPAATNAISFSSLKSAKQPSFTFRAPKQASGAPSKRPRRDHEPKYSFRAPKSAKKEKAVAAAVPVAASSFNNVMAAPNVAPFSAGNTMISSSSLASSQIMPDLTTSSGFGAASGGMMATKLKTGSVMDILGGGPSKLPDVTESTPSSKGQELKKGSVMDILGKSSSNSWNFGSSSNTPWNN